MGSARPSGTYSAAGSVRPASGSEIAGRVPPASTAGTTGPLRPAPSSTSGSSSSRGTAALCADTARPPRARSAAGGGAQVQPWSALALRQPALTPSTSCSTSAVLGIAQPLPLAASTEASSEHAESQGALTAPARDSASAGAQPQCPSVTASPPSPLPPTPPAGPPRHGARCARQGGGGSVRSSTIVTIPTVTRARRQVVGPTPKPHCRRQCGNAARAAALGLCSPPPCVKDGTREVEGAPPRLERVLALACGSERRTDRRSAPLAAVSAGRTSGTRGCILPPPLDLPPAAAQVRGGHTQPYVRTRRGHPAKERRGPRRVDMHGQAAPTRKGPAAYLWSSWTAARFSHRELGRRRGHLEPAAGALPSWQAVSTSLTRALGGGEPFRPLVA